MSSSPAPSSSLASRIERCELLVLCRQRAVPSESIDRPALRDRHQPRARVAGHAVAGPLHERVRERFLGEVLGEADVVDAAREAGDESRELEAKDRLDRDRRGCRGRRVDGHPAD